MKRIVSLLCAGVIFTTLFTGCTNKSHVNFQNRSETSIKSDSILDELSPDKRIDDFKNAVYIIDNLKDNKRNFLKQVKKLDKICKNNSISEDSNICTKVSQFTKQGLKNPSEEEINQFCNFGWRMKLDLLNSLVYPVLFDKEGFEVSNVEGLNANNAIKAIEDKGFTLVSDTTNEIGITTKEWSNPKNPNESHYKLIYYSNGLVRSVTVPIATAENIATNDNLGGYDSEQDFEDFWTNGGRIKELTKNCQPLSDETGILAIALDDYVLKGLSNYLYLEHGLCALQTLWNSSFQCNKKDIDKWNISSPMLLKGTFLFLNYSANNLSLTVGGKNDDNKVVNYYNDLLIKYVYHSKYSAINYQEKINHFKYLNTIELDSCLDFFKVCSTYFAVNFLTDGSEESLNKFAKTVPYASRYSLFDVDHDGKKELIVDAGDYEVGRTYMFFKPINNQIKLIDEETGSHSGLYEDKGDLIIASGHMGVERAYRITSKDGKLNSEQLYDRDVGLGEYYHWPNKVKSVEIKSNTQYNTYNN